MVWQFDAVCAGLFLAARCKGQGRGPGAMHKAAGRQARRGQQGADWTGSSLRRGRRRWEMDTSRGGGGGGWTPSSTLFLVSWDEAIGIGNSNCVMESGVSLRGWGQFLQSGNIERRLSLSLSLRVSSVSSVECNLECLLSSSASVWSPSTHFSPLLAAQTPRLTPYFPARVVTPESCHFPFPIPALFQPDERING